MVLSKFYDNLSWSNKRRWDKIASWHNKIYNKKESDPKTNKNVVELTEDFIAQTILFDTPKYVIGYSVYVEQGMPKMNVIECPPPKHNKDCKCSKCITMNLEEVDRIIKRRNKDEPTTKQYK